MALDTPAALRATRGRRLDHDPDRRTRGIWRRRSRPSVSNAAPSRRRATYGWNSPTGINWIARLVEAFPDRIRVDDLGQAHARRRVHCSHGPSLLAGSQSRGAVGIRPAPAARALAREFAAPRPWLGRRHAGRERKWVRFVRQRNRRVGAIGPAADFLAAVRRGPRPVVSLARDGGAKVGSATASIFFPAR